MTIDDMADCHLTPLLGTVDGARPDLREKQVSFASSRRSSLFSLADDRSKRSVRTLLLCTASVILMVLLTVTAILFLAYKGYPHFRPRGSMDIVIAYYNRSMSAMNEMTTVVSESHPVQSRRVPPNYMIYTKHSNDPDHLLDLSSQPLINKVIPLENIGRELHTFLTHIVRNYDRLADHTFFCRAFVVRTHCKYCLYDGHDRGAPG